jgi:hypothetical protein
MRFTTKRPVLKKPALFNQSITLNITLSGWKNNSNYSEPGYHSDSDSDLHSACHSSDLTGSYM